MTVRQLRALRRPITIEDLRNPLRSSGFNYVSTRGASQQRPKPYYAEVNAGSGRNQRAYRGPSRRTAEEAALDYVRWFNNEPPIRVYERASSGRPDFYMDDKGTLHMDLPPETTITPAKKSTTKKSSERNLMLRMQDTVSALMKPYDIAEAKAGVGRQQIATAAGQLLIKRHEQGCGRMFIVLPEKPAQPLCKFLESQDITIVTEEVA